MKTTAVNWTLIAKLPTDGVYPGGPDYGAFRVSHTAPNKMNVECLLAETGIGTQRRRLVPRPGKPQKWAASEIIGARL